MRDNVTLQVLRGVSTTNDLGDTEDVNTVVAELSGFIRETSFRRGEHTGASTDTDAQLRVSGFADVRTGDRISTSEGKTYVVRGRQRMHLIGKGLLLDLERISGRKS